MAVFLANKDVEQLISMRDCIDSVEQAYRELGMGCAWNNPRVHTCGKAPRPKDDREITILKNNGLSVQFAGVGAAVMQRAKERGLGRELPSYLFEAAYRT